MEALTKVRWAHLWPDEFIQRLTDLPVVYIPFGLCEPHGHIAPFGLDTLKADYYCEQAAERFGGIVAPTQAYHIHECGFHGPWLDEVVGETNPRLGSMPPKPMCYHFLYQLRAFANAGFRGVVGVSGHHGGSQKDLRLVGKHFSQATGIPVVVKSDPEWVEGQHTGDHAGAYEISQLLNIYPESIRLDRLERMYEKGSGGRMAQGEDASEATVEKGHAINEAVIASIANCLKVMDIPSTNISFIDYEQTESIWRKIEQDPEAWHSLSKD